MLKRLSNLQLLGITVLLLVLSFGLAVYPTVSFVRGFFMGTLHPLELFDTGETVSFVDPTPYSGYLISMEVGERNAEVPALDIQLAKSDGSVPETIVIDRWNSIMGREYKQVLLIDPIPDGHLTIRIESEENQDFLLYRQIDDVLERELGRSMPLWIVALCPFVLTILCIGILMARYLREPDQPSLPLEDLH